MYKRLNGVCVVTVLMLLVGIPDLRAQQTTRVVVHAKAKDAKFIGNSMSGARVQIKNAQTGELLAEGLTKGSTGDTEKLVKVPKQRYSQVSTEDAAKYVVELKLDQPTFVTISASGPQQPEQAQAASSTQLWLIPGKDLLGDGVMLEIPGFAISILEPQGGQKTAGDSVTITAKAQMMCGCPIAPDGLWDSNEMEFVAVLSKEGKELSRKKMDFSGKTSIFETAFSPTEPGIYDVIVYGYDSRTGNTGVDKVTFTKG